MHRVAIAVGSFLLGVLVTCLWSSRATTIVPSALAEVAQHQSAENKQTGAEPVVPPLDKNKAGADATIGGKGVESLQLDGINCEDCTIEADTVSYAGGAYRCEDCFLKAKQVQLKGAAFNTLVFMRQVTVSGNSMIQPKLEVPEDKHGVKLSLLSAVQ